MRILRITGMFIFVATTCLTIFSVGAASAKEPSGAGRSGLASADPRPRFDFLLATLQEPPAKPHSDTTKQTTLPPGEGLDTTKRLCSTCHTTDVFAKQRHTKEKWNEIIDNMVSKGLEASDDDLEKVASYLGANLGPDNPVPAAADKPAAKADQKN